MRRLKFAAVMVILAGWLIPGQLLAADYPDKGAYPTPMWGTSFRVEDPLNPGTTFNDDGTNSKQPATDAGSVTWRRQLSPEKADYPAAHHGERCHHLQGQVLRGLQRRSRHHDHSYAYQHAGNTGLYYAQDSITRPWTLPSPPPSMAATPPPSPPPTCGPGSGYPDPGKRLSDGAAGGKFKYFIPNLPQYRGAAQRAHRQRLFRGRPFSRQARILAGHHRLAQWDLSPDPLWLGPGPENRIPGLLGAAAQRRRRLGKFRLHDL